MDRSSEINETSRDKVLKELEEEKEDNKTTEISDEDKRLNELIKEINKEKEGEK